MMLAQIPQTWDYVAAFLLFVRLFPTSVFLNPIIQLCTDSVSIGHWHTIPFKIHVHIRI